MPLSGVLAVALAMALDRWVEEFPRRIHPVTLLGKAIAPLDREWRAPRLVGAVGVLLLASVVAGIVAGGVALAERVDPLLAGLLAGLVLFVTTSLAMLVRLAHEVIEDSQSDPAAAREALPSLVGRDPGELSPAEMRSAAVESAAENFADGLVAPLFAFTLLAPVSLGLAAGASAWVKTINTADAMLGYRSKPVGFAAARLDDAVMWLPARISAVLVAVAARDLGALRRALPWVYEPPSPNSGWPMATLAAALGVELSKPGAYSLFPDADLPSVEVGRRGVRFVELAGGLTFGLAGVIAWL